MRGNMADVRENGPKRAAQQVSAALGRVEVLALFPILALSATWFGFDNIALLTAVGLSVLLAFGVIFGRVSEKAQTLPLTSAGGRAALVAMLDRVSGQAGRDTACFLIQIDEWAVIHDRWGHDTSEDIALRLEERLQSALRNGDLLTRLGDSRFGVVLAPLSSARLGLRDTIAQRLAEAVADPISLRGTALRLSASIGHSSMVQHGVDPASETFKAAEAALGEAVLHAPCAIRAYAPGMGRARTLQSSLSEEVEAAIHDGAITAWFQPQVHARTGVIAGMETLARWQHPKHGLLGPAEFLPAVEASGHMPLLGQSMLHQSLKALQGWDSANAHIPLISINFSAGELRDKTLATALTEEVARYDISPDRVVVEILEGVAKQTEDDAIVATLQAMRDAGHRLDLDGFGLGAASLPQLQRFGVTRVKIDHSFVLGVDGEHSKRQAVAAIIAMAKALRIETLANGVETSHQQETLCDLGCEYLQGFGIARPMGADNVADWARAHSAAGKTIHLDDRRA